MSIEHIFLLQFILFLIKNIYNFFLEKINRTSFFFYLEDEKNISTKYPVHRFIASLLYALKRPFPPHQKKHSSLEPQL